MVVATSTQFDERNPRYYKCCCCHVRTGVIAISIFEIVVEVLVLVSAVFTPDEVFIWNNVPGVKWSVPVYGIIIIVCAVLAIVGMRDIKPTFLIPHIVIQAITLVTTMVGIVCLIILAIVVDPAGTFIITVIIIFIIVFSLAFVFDVWFLVVFVYGYKYLNDRKEFLVNNQNSTVTGSVPMTDHNPTRLIQQL